jgi:hypothetical protein
MRFAVGLDPLFAWAMAVAFAGNQENQPVIYSEFPSPGAGIVVWCLVEAGCPRAAARRDGGDFGVTATEQKFGEELSRPAGIHQSCNPRVKGRVFLFESAVTL